MTGVSKLFKSIFFHLLFLATKKEAKKDFAKSSSQEAPKDYPQDLLAEMSLLWQLTISSHSSTTELWSPCSGAFGNFSQNLIFPLQSLYEYCRSRRWYE